MKALIKKAIPVTWRNPFVNAVQRFLDPLDYLVRRIKGLDYLPKYSVRVRSRGMAGEFGGERFAMYGNVFKNILIKYANLSPTGKILEIGCGCGTAALSLSEYLNAGGYTGTDIEEVSLQACKSNRRLLDKDFSFDFLDVYNPEYNPKGSTPAKDYRFPYEDATFDVVFLSSVFTHMLTEDVINYIQEIGRILRPGGFCVTTVLLMNHGENPRVFPYRQQMHYSVNQSMPEVAVGYDLEFFTTEYKKVNMSLTRMPLTDTGFPQDVLIFRK